MLEIISEITQQQQTTYPRKSNALGMSTDNLQSKTTFRLKLILST